MSEKTIKHFILSRFFPFQRGNFPYDVLDVDFLSKQLPLAKNMLRSLENQTNKNFELVFRVNSKFCDNSKYKFIFSTLKNSTTLPLTFINGGGGLFEVESNSGFLALLKDSLNKYDFVITTRMDFDDFVYKDAVADTQSKVEECEDILAYGYNKGYTCIYNELYSRVCTWWKNTGHESVFQSLILKSSSVKELPYVVVEKFDHPLIKSQIKTFVEENGLRFSENMFQENSVTNAFIYVRHAFAQEQLAVHGGKPFNTSGLKLLTTKDITKKQLEEEFGFFHELNSIK